MRTPTKATLGIVSLAILAGSYTSAQANFASTSTVAAGTTDPTVDSGSTVTAATGDTTATTAPTTVAPGTTTTTTQASTGTTSTGSSSGNTGNTATGSSGTATTPAPTSGNSSSGNTSTGSSGGSASGTHTGSAIGYRYGVIQLEVVKTGSNITAINLVQASTKGREYAAVPSMLVSAALSANGSNFSNVGGATFTSEAFRSALESALAQF